MHTSVDRFGRCRHDILRSRAPRENGAHGRRARDQPEIARQVEYPRNDAVFTCARARHHPCVVGRLKQRVTVAVAP